MHQWSSEALQKLYRDYEVMLVVVLDAILERYAKNPSYPFVDTKLNLISGKDFSSAPGALDFKGPDTIFGWIQGRGLESLVGHARWLPRCKILNQEGKIIRLEKLTRAMGEILENLEAIRRKNHGHLFFSMTPDGEPFRLDEQGAKEIISLAGAPFNMSDLFFVKGLKAASIHLFRSEMEEEADQYFLRILAAIEQDSFASDQVSFDPMNPVKKLPGVKGHGSRMIALGGLALFAEHSSNPVWLKTGERFLSYIMENHVHLEEEGPLQPYDFWESIDERGEPLNQEGKILSDPGHALEFVGLAARLILKVRNGPLAEDKRLERFIPDLLGILKHCFSYGFNEQAGGLYKSFDLSARKPINSDMPWWNLPETIRAAGEMLLLCPEKDKPDLQEILMKCSNSFFENYINPDVHLMAYQTLDFEGKPIDVIPATPDADPGYHTGLSIIDFLACLDLGI